METIKENVFDVEDNLKDVKLSILRLLNLWSELVAVRVALLEHVVAVRVALLEHDREKGAALDRTNYKLNLALSDSEQGNYNDGKYVGEKTFTMKPGDKFGFMLVPNGTVRDVFNNPAIGSDKRPLFSLVTANPNQAFQSGQIDQDTLYGRLNDDLLDAEAGQDAVYGNEGNDTLESGDDDDYLEGETGFDKLYGQAGNDELYGDPDDYFLIGEARAVSRFFISPRFNGQAGNDTLIAYGQAGNDELYGDPDDDFLIGETGVSLFFISPRFNGQAGNDTLIAEEGNDKLWDGENDDLLLAEAGDHYLDGGAGNDSLDAGDGDDNLLGQTGNDILDAGNGNDTLSGGEGNDKLAGLAGDDILDRGEGSDRIFANEGDDELFGQVGDDYLDGGAGNDILIFYTGYCGVGVLPASEFIDLLQNISNRLFENEDGNDFSKGNEGNDILKSQKCSIRILLNKQKMSIFPATVAGKSNYLAKFSEQEHHYKRQFLPLTPISNNRFSPALVSTCLLTVALQQTCAVCLFTEIYIIKVFQICVAPVSIVATTESYKTQRQLASDKDAIASLIHLLTINTSLLEEVTRGMSFVAIMTKLSISALGAFKVCSDSPDRAPPLIHKASPFEFV